MESAFLGYDLVLFSVVFQQIFVASSDGWGYWGLNSAHLNASSLQFWGLNFGFEAASFPEVVKVFWFSALRVSGPVVTCVDGW